MEEVSENWAHRGQRRPRFAETPAPGQESVWDFPRPPICVPEPREALVRRGESVVARSRDCLRVLETASAPSVYFPPAAVRRDWLCNPRRGSVCEWKGVATYWDLALPGVQLSAACWSYERPSGRFAELAGWLSFYPALLECWLGGERVRPQPGGFYGGWVTAGLAGPIKGAPGTESW